MRLGVLLAVCAVFLFSGCRRSPQPNAVVLVNAAAVDAVVLERVRTFAERELHVPVRTRENPRLAGRGGFQQLNAALQKKRADEDVILILLAGVNGESSHLSVFAESASAVVNVLPLYTDDTEKFTRRVERQVMRAAAFAVGLPPTPDPFCVTRDYSSLEDLDTMGRNYSPPWQGRFAEEAARRGLLPVPGGY